MFILATGLEIAVNATLKIALGQKKSWKTALLIIINHACFNNNMGE